MYEPGANEFTVEEIEALFNEELAQSSPPADDDNAKAKEPTDNTVDKVDAKVSPPEADPTQIDKTKAFATRLKESTEKARREEREEIAKSLGYTSYNDMIKDREAKLLTEKGLDPETVAPIVDELVKKRLNEDPRMKELDDLRAKQIKEFGQRELVEITKLTDGEITKLEQLPKEVVELWKQKGSLKAAYLELKGEELIVKAKSGQSKGTTDHLQLPDASNPGTRKVRPLTLEEKQIWRVFNPGITEAELNKKTTEI